MNIHFGNQSQFELFPGTTGQSIESVAPRFIFSRITLTFENLVVVIVAVIVGMIVTFSIGVEKGKKWASQTRSMAQLAIPAVATPVNEPAPTTVIPAVQPLQARPAEAAREEIVSAPPDPQPSVVAPSEKSVDKIYTIQVASYKKDSMAQKEAMELKKKGYESLTVSKGDYVIVCVGKFAKEDQAKAALKKLKSRYKDSYIRSL